MDKDFLAGKSVLVMGLGQFGGGADSAVFASQAGANVTVTDLADEDSLAGPLEQLASCDIEYHLGGHHIEDFKNADIIIVNPAVPADNKFLQIAQNANKLITSQIEIFFQLCPCRIVGITGANGKSTTTALTAHLLQEGADLGEVWLSGNIGNRPLLRLLEKIQARDVIVLELSSFQLDQLGRIQKGPDVSVITNLTPNHLDRHGTFEAYCAAKENIFKFQKIDQSNPAVSIFNAEDPVTAEWFARYSKQRSRRCLAFKAADVPDQLRQAFKLPGVANLSNLAAAAAVAREFGLGDEQMVRAVGTFEPLEHRLQLVAEIDGVRWYNDSIATTPASAIAALEAFAAPKIIIAGGYDKGLAFDELGKKIAQKAKAAILIGKTAAKIDDAIRKAGKKNVQAEFAHSMAQAVNLANRYARNGDVVLLSPACASYDMFTNFQQRGQVFTNLVKARIDRFC
ncbi:MAG: UDP-N-acetylmuramoyl-L-alanine--D-glutamate ligase [Planctomycetota bacterium]|jgi:UDP-N-acetylmuramoylalanine--D-glutamate ligase